MNIQNYKHFHWNRLYFCMETSELIEFSKLFGILNIVIGALWYLQTLLTQKGRFQNVIFYIVYEA